MNDGYTDAEVVAHHEGLYECYECYEAGITLATLEAAITHLQATQALDYVVGFRAGVRSLLPQD